MKRFFFFVILLILIFSSPIVNSQIRMDENFNYPEGDSLTQHGWVAFSGLTVNALMVATPGLTFSGYPLSNIGNSCKVYNTGMDAYKEFTSVTENNVYCAMMVRVDSARTGNYFFAYLPDNSTTNYVSRTFIKVDGANIAFGLSKSTDVPTYTPSIYTEGTTYLLVIKYTFNTGSSNDDQMSLFVFNGPVPGTEPAPNVGPITGTVNDAPNISRVALRQGTASSSPTLWVDGIRVFLSWSNILGIKTINTTAESFSLSQNYPNPFNPETKIRFSIPERGNVTITIYDMLGREISGLVNGSYNRGLYEVSFDGKGIASGVYLYKMSYHSETGKQFTDTKKLVLAK